MEETVAPKVPLSTQLWRYLQYSTQIKDRQKFMRLWKEAYTDFKHDLRTARWLRGFGWFVGTMWFGGLIGMLISSSVVALDSTNNVCQPDGNFRLHPEKYNIWSSSGFFEITLGAGHLTFAQAKAVDIVWDGAVGRGGQFLLSFISWRVFKRYFTVCMEVQPVTYQLFRAVFLEHEASLSSTCGAIKSFIWQRRLRSKIAMIFMVLTMIFILLFPTLTSALSGYGANVESYVPDVDKSFFRFRSYRRVVYVIHDGWRINQDGNFWIMDIGISPGSFREPVLSNSVSCTISPDYGEGACDLQLSISDYVKKHGLGGKKNESSQLDMRNTTAPPTTWNNMSLPAPVLNISAFTTDDKGLGGANSSDILPPSWMRENKTFDISWVEKMGSCQTVGDYQWGFSFQQFFMCLVLLLIWTVGIYAMWLRAHFTMALRKYGPEDISGEHRAVLELAEAMKVELNIADTGPSMLREKGLRERVNNELKGGTISYASANAEPQTYSMRQQLKHRFKKEKWWFAAIFVTSVLCGTLWMSRWETLFFTFWMGGLWFGLVFAMCLGMTNGSRALITLFWSIVSAIVIGSVVIWYRHRFGL